MVLALVLISFLAIFVVLYALWRDSQGPEIELDEPTTISYAPGKPSSFMAVPKSRPMIESRSTKRL